METNAVFKTLGIIFEWINSVPQSDIGMAILSVAYFSLVILGLKWICKKFNIVEGIEANRQKIIETIKASEDEKRKCEEEYKQESQQKW